MKICVYGAGAVGAHLGVRCALGGANTSLVARGATLDAVRRNGLVVRTVDTELQAAIRASNEPAHLGVQDVVIVAVKAPALASVAQNIDPLLGPATRVIFAMNGIPWWYFHQHGGPLEGTLLPKVDPGSAMWDAVGPDRAVGAVIYSPAAVVEPGIIQLAQANNRLVVGEPDGSQPALTEQLTGILNKGGLQTELSKSIRDVIWSKLQNNIASGLMAILTQCPVNEIAAEPACEQAMRTLLDETAAVARRLGRSPSSDVEKVIASMKALVHKPSILQDLESNRLMEIDTCYSVVVDLADMTGVATPMLNLLVSLARLRAGSAGLLANNSADTARFQ